MEYIKDAKIKIEISTNSQLIEQEFENVQQAVDYIRHIEDQIRVPTGLLDYLDLSDLER